MEIVLQQKQQLNLVMTTELKQAIELLQYSTIELEQYIREQELDNPLIELKENAEQHRESTGTTYRSSPSDQSGVPLDAIPGHDLSMRDELFEQVNLLHIEQSNRRLLGYLIYNLNDSGYLDLPHPDAHFSEEEISVGIELLQEIGPPGIGARNLKECLLLQIAQNTHKQELLTMLVDNHLHLIADRKWSQISAEMNISMAEVQKLYEMIQTLNPRPCNFNTERSTRYITPDIIVDIEEDELVFQLNDHYLPTIHFNNTYSTLSQNGDEVSKYVDSQQGRYQWLLNSIEQRRNTIIKIVEVLLVKQEKFFRNGFLDLSPLTMKEIAEEIDMHESTVSRATRNKVIQTPLGSFDLRLLFTSKAAKTKGEGEDISQTRVKALLEQLIEKENKQKPYSDQKIADYFKEEKEISISRRTIAKYRQELDIPSSSRRKEIVI